MVKEISSGSTSQLPPNMNMNMNMMPNMSNMGGGVAVNQLSNGASFEGEYINAKNGHHITVRNTAIDGDSMIFITNEGPISAEEFSSYVKMENDSNDEYNVQQPMVDMSSKMYEQGYEADIANILKPRPQNNINKLLDVEVKKETEQKNSRQNKQENVVTKKLDKFFGKINTSPDIKLNIRWDDFPFDKFSTICDFLDISDEALDYIYDKYFNKEEIKKAIASYFNLDVDD